MSVEGTEAEREAIKTLRERVLNILLPYQDEDYFFKKWLIAYKYDIDKAEEMIKGHIKFMKTHGLDKLDENYVPPKASDYFHTKMLGYDNEGSVVRILHLGASDIRGLTMALSKMDSIRFATYVLICDGRRQRKERENDTICHKQVYIFDLQGLNWTSIIQRSVVERTFTLLKNYERNHPESLKIVYVINAPSFFNFIHNWLKTVLPESIISKLCLLSKEECPALLGKHIDLSILPASVGGTMVDVNGNPNCPSLYKMPLNIPVPESLMLYNQFCVLDNDPNAMKTTVECGALFKVPCIVSEPNSNLQWDYQTLNFDICFGLSFRKDEISESKPIMTPRRVESHRIPESGNFFCEETGIYELIFDNTYSWFTKKDLVYKASVLPPHTDEEED
ncbi:SEC14-like protein 2 [Trichonephila clavata]|uniref:SEC14-like protein 2 n=1 Tax=Trichonephila clavata TaxID=2740835 RepID=A0A8X6FAJ9_TRICU|nr:SEC14-like protein 2 [Trichonephila clavata]